VIETHLHADFVSGHRELAERTGAEIVFGAKAAAGVPHRPVSDGDELRIGAAALRILETPGHTPESISVLAFEKASDAQPKLVLTGDTLFIGDVGRPDLVGKQGLSAETMAAALYDSLHQKLLRLPDAVLVYPAHGAGSLCGKNLSKETSSTIGEQRRSNYALQPMSKDAFVRMLTSDLPEVPQYFPTDVEINRRGAAPLAERKMPAPLAPRELAARQQQGAIVLDVRDAASLRRRPRAGIAERGSAGTVRLLGGHVDPLGQERRDRCGGAGARAGSRDPAGARRDRQPGVTSTAGSRPGTPRRSSSGRSRRSRSRSCAPGARRAARAWRFSMCGGPASTKAATSPARSRSRSTGSSVSSGASRRRARSR
jgi:glyoxylase-like metal-dependent hydrolase (beta-lactamase superfamily II)